MKRTLFVILATAIMLTLVVFLPTTAEAKKSGDFVYTVTDGKAEITSYLGSDSELIIPSEFDSVPVTNIGGRAFENNNSLTSVIIPDSVVSISSYAFDDCQSLCYVTLGNNVKTIGSSAFSGCRSLSNISFPDTLVNVSSYAFKNTHWLDSQPYGVVYAGKVAYLMKGESPADVVLKNGTKGIAAYAFSECKTLEKVTIPDTVSLINSGAFRDCVSLESVTIGDSVTTIENSAFWGCVSLESIVIPDSVTEISYSAFEGCSSLQSATILNKSTKIFNSFFMCKELTIYGYRNSTAETYANENNIPFVPLDGEPTTEPTTQVITEPTTQVPTVAPTTEPSTKPILGDIDGDGQVTVSDATLIQQYAAQMDTPYPIGEPIE